MNKKTPRTIHSIMKTRLEIFNLLYIYINLWRLQRIEVFFGLTNYRD